jgi:pyruvate,water dikinase
MERSGIPVPETSCISAEAYERYVSVTGLRERILLELSRKDFGDMRWEELWDASLRIRNMFLRTPLPGNLATTLSDALEARFRGRPVAVRSSAPGEDSDTVSFAGLHESFVNVTGIESILERIRLVWASLWSDAALLYRRDLGLDVRDSAMAVVVQEMVIGERSGVAFSRSPNDSSHAVIESVYGLNQGLVDGAVEPDQWTVDRASGKVMSHVSASRDQVLVAETGGVRLKPLPEGVALQPPLTCEEVKTVFNYAQRLEAMFGQPQDVEWTWGADGLVVLQSRPITTLASEDPDDERRWYLSLRRSFDNLQSLRDKIEEELIPGMVEEANRLAAQAVDGLSDEDLAAEIDRREAMYERWVDVYWDQFIPFAHGIRLFGQVYNDALHPGDPYAFMDLLAGTEMASLARNRALEQMAAMIRDDAHLADALREGLAHNNLAELDEAFMQQMDDFVRRFGDLSCAITGGARCDETPETLIKILLEMARRPPAHERWTVRDVDAMREEYLDRFEGDERAWAAELLDLARSSYRLRDDDNVYLGRIEAEALATVEEGRRRLKKRGMEGANAFDGANVARALRNLDFVPEVSPEEEAAGDFVFRARQLVGQPAGPGVAQGPARVILSQADLKTFAHREVLICDAVDPNMTFVVPLASAVVERRGGMLIHGAIIAREYGLPCVTGVPDATSLIRTGDLVTVDGYLGIVTLMKRREASADQSRARREGGSSEAGSREAGTDGR